MYDLEARIATERTRRLNGAADVGTWRYWIARGDNRPPPEEHWCGYCAGWYGVPHDGLHQDGLCRSLGTGQCACIDCWACEGRTEKRPAWTTVGLTRADQAAARRAVVDRRTVVQTNTHEEPVMSFTVPPEVVAKVDEALAEFPPNRLLAIRQVYQGTARRLGLKESRDWVDARLAGRSVARTPETVAGEIVAAHANLARLYAEYDGLVAAEGSGAPVAL